MEARGEAYMREGVEDVVFAFMRFPSGVAAHLHLSWLDPHKTRAFTVVGSKRMATFDDMELERKVTVYDKGFDEKAESYGEYITRSGDIRSPRIANKEPLRIECEHFVDSIRNGTKPRSDGEAGLRVVRVLAGLQESLKRCRLVDALAARRARHGPSRSRSPGRGPGRRRSARSARRRRPRCTAGSHARSAGALPRSRHAVMSSSQPGSCSYSPDAWCITVWWYG